MTKKDFELIATVVAVSEYDGVINHEALTLNFADALAERNPRFDRERFIAACSL